MIIKSWIIIFLLALKFTDEVSAKSEWVGRLSDYLKSEVYQILVLFDPKKVTESSEVSAILQNISRVVPTWKISVEKATDKKSEDLSLLPAFSDPRSTILNLVIYSNEDDSSPDEDLIRFMTKVSESQIRPKCLIIFPRRKKESIYQQLFRKMWLQRFLDVTILELEADSVSIHRFNPFTGIFSKEHYNSQSEWFPEKNRDLHHYQIKVGLFHFPPSTNVIYNQTGDVIEASGSDVIMTRCLAKAMNFQISWMSSKVRLWGASSCIKEKNMGLVRSLVYNRIQFTAVQSGRSLMCKKPFYTISTDIRQARLVVVVPNFHEESYLLTKKWKFDTLFFLFLFLLINWIVSKCFHFEDRNWQLDILFQIVLGFGTPREPRKSAERIVFGSILIACLLLSSYFYTALTSIQLQKRTKIVFESLDDVLSANLETVISPAVYNFVLNSTEQNVRILVKKSTQLDISYEDCLDYLMQSKNIACIVRDDIAGWMIENQRDSCGRPRMKIVPEYILSSISAIYAEAASPYLSRINKLIWKFKENGLMQKWTSTGKLPGRQTEFEDEICSTRGAESGHIIILLIIFLVFGYSCSLIAFCCEVGLGLIRKR
ncbi:uncharacterized protein LOC117170787 [Belonocnema kinseyi]|uniref:uncharacterized protein LOC117170787 n=1 Tax=Belonocnema kinseyi TaxID=2817044 RepID=UPI00143D36AD|nr:uncharacterized protein LOC117170787 [Belonocnema kinseyi]